jgi:hypothetical protein
MKREWIILGVYYALLLIYPIGDWRITYITALDIGISIVFIFLYRIIKDEVLFYVYNFIALLGIVFSLANYNPYSPVTLALAYISLSLLLLHITYYRFTLLFGMVKIDTIIYTLLSIPLAYLSIYLFLIYPMGYGFWGIFMLVMLSIIILYFLMRSPEPKKSSHTS